MKRFIWLSLSILFVVAGSSANAQDEADAGAQRHDELELEEVIVTGSRIKRRDFSSPSPLVTISQDDIAFSGQPTLEEYLNRLPQLQPGTGRTTNNGSEGIATLDLRGLGPGRTLVLLNGRRIAPSGTGSAIDVNNLPSILIDRVEIITGGASTVYGSDAIAGVVNFITRDDFTGLSVEGSYSVTERGDADIWDANLVYGLELPGGGNLTFYGGRYERKELFAGERKISAVPLTEDWFSGMFFEAGSATNPGGTVGNPQIDFGNGPAYVTWDPDGIPRAFIRPDDLYNYAPSTYLQTPLSRDTVGILGRVPVGLWEAYFEASYARNRAKSNLAPAPYTNFAVVNTDNPELTPETRALFSRDEFAYEPGLAAMYLGKRLLELGPRIVDHDRKYLRLLAGVRGALGHGWELDAWMTYTDADESKRYFNTGSNSRIQQGLLVDPATGECFDTSGGCVPVNLFGEGNLSAEALDFIRVDDVVSTTSRKQLLAGAVLTGSPFEIWTGPVDMAFGAEWRRDEAHFQADPLFYTGDAIGLTPDAAIHGTESVYELYSEAILTLFRSRSSHQKLDLEIGGRWSHYDNAGSVTTWKAGLNLQLAESFRLRTMLQHAVRAPNNAELFQAQFSNIGNFIDEFGIDPCSASSDPAANGNVEKCMLQGLPEDQIGVFEATPYYPTEFIGGGNPNLDPESSDTFTAGAVFSPVAVPELTMTVDYYDLKVKDTIGSIQPDIICFDPLNSAGVFCDNLERDDTGNVSRVTALIENRGKLATKGVDAQIQYSMDLPAGLALIGGNARLSVGAVFTHVYSLDFQENIVTQVIDCAGKFGWPCWQLLSGNTSATYPANRLTANFDYRSGPLTAHLTWRWIDGTDNAAPLGSAAYGVPEPVLAAPSVGSWNYLDLGFAYEWDMGLLLRLGVNNLTDKRPPVMGNIAQLEHNTDALLYDVLGRAYYVNLRYQFNF